MPEISSNVTAKVWGAELFPQNGRIPRDFLEVTKNHDKQTAEERSFRGESKLGRKQYSACCHSVHLSLFFDGTNNNDYRDTKDGHPSNVAKLFHSSFRGAEAAKSGYFSYYMPGVGTAFPEIGELDYSEDGLKYATGGEDRVNWALASLADALHKALAKSPLSQEDLVRAVKSMRTAKVPMGSILGRGKRRQAMTELLASLPRERDRIRPKVLGIKLYVYGFSRGAAEARAFVAWLCELLEPQEDPADTKQSFAGLPISIEFLGLMDTVASVGIANVVPFFAGHMDWADDTQLLPDPVQYPDFVKCCRHFVAAFEQRACFPLDSVRNEDGQYPPNTIEVVYPGVHSDVGGGYPKNDQGKAREGIDELISQIALHDMYASAFAAGAPLQVPAAVLPERLWPQQRWRVMSTEVKDEFALSDSVVQRFNAWRLTLPGITHNPTPSNPHEPVRLSATLEEVLSDQISWITGWRIGRFANDTVQQNDSYKQQPFFLHAGETTPYDEGQQRAEYKLKQEEILKARVESKGEEAKHPGDRIYEPLRDKTQMSEAATEFKRDYRGLDREQTSAAGTVFDVVLRDTVYLLNAYDEAQDHAAIKAAGEARCKQLFRDTHGTPSTEPNMALLVALFDDQIHDSRAWFMYDAMSSREMWHGYFFYRMLYFGNKSSRSMSPVVVAGQLLGVAVLAGATVYGIKRSGALGAIGGLAAGIGGATIGYQVIDKVTGKVVPFLPEAAKLLQATNEVAKVASEQKNQMALDGYLQRVERTTAMLREAGNLIELEGGTV